MAQEQFQQRCRDFFHQADTGGNGTLSKKELYGVCVKAGSDKSADEVLTWFDELDKNDDDQVSEEEFISALTKISPKDVTQANLKAAFQKLDLDKSGHITLDELKKVCEEAGEDPSLADLDMDLDDDGKVTLPEFMRAFKQAYN